MKHGSKNLIAAGLVLLFALGVLCSTLVGPSLSLASVTGCSESSPMKMTGCEHPSYLCGFDSSNLISQGAVDSSRANDFWKYAHHLSMGDVPFDRIRDVVSAGDYTRDVFLVHGLHKISTRLFNSILNL